MHLPWNGRGGHDSNSVCGQIAIRNNSSSSGSVMIAQISAPLIETGSTIILFCIGMSCQYLSLLQALLPDSSLISASVHVLLSQLGQQQYLPPLIKLLLCKLQLVKDILQYDAGCS